MATGRLRKSLGPSTEDFQNWGYSPKPNVDEEVYVLHFWHRGLAVGLSVIPPRHPSRHLLDGSRKELQSGRATRGTGIV